MISSLTTAACGSNRAAEERDAGPVTSDAEVEDAGVQVDAGPVEGRDAAAGDGGTDAGTTPDEPYVNPSELHYAARTADTHEHAEEEELADEWERAPYGTLRFTLAGVEPRPAWTSREGRAATRHLVGVTAEALSEIDDPDLDFTHGTCASPQYFTESRDTTTPAGITLATPRAVFEDVNEAYAWLKTVRARTPIFLPFRHPDVVLSQGWYYDDGDYHGAQDFSRTGVEEGEDSTFLVRAMSWGVVRDIYYSRGGGNIVVIEHTAPTGERYLSRYMHMRNGRSNDIAQALAIDCSDYSGSRYVRCNKYRLYAQDYPDHGGWGEEDHTLRVSIGDTVSAGQIIGWAGNTGVGGAGSGLEDDGTPTSWKGNVHLHSDFAYQHPSEPDSYIIIDPYGVYAKSDGEGCYDLLADTEFDRMFAPFMPTFHGIPLEVFVHYFNYYVGMDRALRTMSVHREGSRVLVSGSFQRGLPGAWAAHVYMSPTESVCVANMKRAPNSRNDDGW